MISLPGNMDGIYIMSKEGLDAILVNGFFLGIAVTVLMMLSIYYWNRLLKNREDYINSLSDKEKVKYFSLLRRF